jgi:hypothetical protein
VRQGRLDGLSEDRGGALQVVGLLRDLLQAVVIEESEHDLRMRDSEIGRKPLSTSPGASCPELEKAAQFAGVSGRS